MMLLGIGIDLQYWDFLCQLDIMAALPERQEWMYLMKEVRDRAQRVLALRQEMYCSNGKDIADK
jgi:hypothetical protein